MFVFKGEKLMDPKKSLVVARSNGIGKIINNVVELIKSRVDKNYIISERTPDFLKRDKGLIIKTIKKTPDYLDHVPDDILLEELQQKLLPEEGIINTAFKSGYLLTGNSYR